jgi:hypothetical protein
MASTTETGHAKNVANFEQLTVDCTALGTSYNPSNPLIKLAALNAQLASAKANIAAVNTAHAANSNAIAARDVVFSPLSKLSTRILNSLKASGTTVQVDESAQTLVRKLQGRRATAKLTDEEKKAAEAAGKSVNEISASQMSFDNRLDNLDKFIKLLTSVTLYAPNEADLKVAALTATYNDLKAKNLAVVNSETALSNARIARDLVLYADNTGMVDISVDVKSYIKSIFGATSPQYKQISKLKFTSRKKK